MTTHKHIPQGTTYTGTEAPRYVPHAQAPYLPGMPRPAGLDTRPLAEVDTWPSVPAHPVDPHTFGSPSPRRVYLTPEPLPVAPVPVRSTRRQRRRHSWLYWRAWWLWWSLVAWWDEARTHTGWLGEIVVMVLIAAVLATLVCTVFLAWVFASTGKVW